jgi:hypothetical protein
MAEQRHNHRIKLEKLIAEGKLKIPAGVISHINVEHDDWCGIHDGARCDCDPNIDIYSEAEYERLLQKGQAS